MIVDIHREPKIFKLQFRRVDSCIAKTGPHHPEMTSLLDKCVEFLQHLFFSFIMPTTSYVFEICIRACMNLYAIVVDKPQIVLAIVIVFATVYLVCRSSVHSELPERRVRFSNMPPTIIEI